MEKFKKEEKYSTYKLAICLLEQDKSCSHSKIQQIGNLKQLSGILSPVMANLKTQACETN